ncbi:MAG: phosphonate ABC transporter ATP-binding protein, partial [Ectopseudomonas oleovorans]
VVTLHQVDYAVRYCQRAVALKGGRIHFDGPTAGFNPDFLNDLYGGDLDISLLLPQGQRPRTVERPLTLAKA